jgi:hypothetical protein
MNALCRTADRVGALRYSDGNLGCCPDSERAPFRVTVVHTSTEGTIAALRTAAELATGLGAELALLWAEEIPCQYRLHDLPVPIEVLERQPQKIVYLSGIRESQVLTQLLLCRDKYTAIPHSLSSHSLVVIGKSAAWWSRPGKKLEMILREAGHQVVPVVAPRTSLFRGHWNWQILLIRLFMGLTARRVGA